MQTTHYGPGRTVRLHDLDYLYFSGTAYLGLSQHPLFKAQLKEGIDRYGANFGGSRRSNLQFEIFEEGENALANWTGAPSALLFSSGTLAGQLLQRLLATKGLVRYAPGTHPALWGFANLPNISYADWVTQISLELSHRKQPYVLFANAVDPLRVQRYDFDWLQQIPEGPKVYLAIDDSHGLGILGEQGVGAYAALKTPPWVEVAVVASLGKALSLPAGVVLGEKSLIQACWESPFFGGASPMPPAYLYAFLQSRDLQKALLKKLRKLIRLFAENTKALGLFESIPDYPVFFTTHNELAIRLLKQQILISSFPYPGPTDDCITRVVINALHEQHDIETLVQSLLAPL